MAQVPQTAAVFKMTLPNYLFLVTIEHGYLLVTPQDIHTILPIDPETQIPRLSSSLDLTQQPVTDSIGNQWILLEEDCQVPEFIELLADHSHLSASNSRRNKALRNQYQLRRISSLHTKQ